MDSKNEKVQEFLDNTWKFETDKFETLQELRKIVFKIYPKTVERIIYGGIMFSIDEEDFGGLFIRKKHISFEFGAGFKMKDPNKILEGGGKFRRHLKIQSLDDIKDKQVEFFVKQVR